MKTEVIIKLESNDALEASVAGKNLQKLADKLKGKGINKFMKMYEENSITVNTFLVANGIF